jgi:hypothetical protein
LAFRPVKDEDSGLSATFGTGPYHAPLGKYLRLLGGDCTLLVFFALLLMLPKLTGMELLPAIPAGFLFGHQEGNACTAYKATMAFRIFLILS